MILVMLASCAFVVQAFAYVLTANYPKRAQPSADKVVAAAKRIGHPMSFLPHVVELDGTTQAKTQFGKCYEKPNDRNFVAFPNSPLFYLRRNARHLLPARPPAHTSHARERRFSSRVYAANHNRPGKTLAISQQHVVKLTKGSALRSAVDTGCAHREAGTLAAGEPQDLKTLDQQLRKRWLEGESGLLEMGMLRAVASLRAECFSRFNEGCSEEAIAREKRETALKKQTELKLKLRGDFSSPGDRSAVLVVSLPLHASGQCERALARILGVLGDCDWCQFESECANASTEVLVASLEVSFCNRFPGRRIMRRAAQRGPCKRRPGQPGSNASAQGRAYITNVCVAPSCRRMGIGRRIINAARCFAEAAGKTDLFILVEAENAAAVALYKECGFILASEHRRRSSTLRTLLHLPLGGDVEAS